MEHDAVLVLADRLVGALAERAAEPLVVGREGAARLLGYGHPDTFTRDCQARRLEGFPQPLPQAGHPRWSVKALRAWVERLDGKPRGVVRRRVKKPKPVGLPATDAAR